MSLGHKEKDPRDSRIFSFAWANDLGTDTIAISTFETEPTGLTVGTTGIVVGGQSTTIALSGGTLGADYLVRNTITRTTSGEVIAKSGILAVREQ